MRTPEEILRRPLLTEKNLKLAETRNKYGFEVLPDANKFEIKRAVQKKFNVEVTAVHVVRVKGKSKRMNTRRGVTSGRRRNYKKAVVTLKAGQKIDFYAGLAA
ncbi:MAG: 50S ribosomal protein L23 [candidate division KSB1 bacterium]|nr:50S ribosomal protein L23 [candidate division KSB1 bacterium]MDZ7272530.1 50S ribosomal protein L23 [candidate division KSB1 bacterium]MDZ7284446.1 50S ribosomal protein L23 [candidate division KSB1 bacterium]MDZ7297158.1 50S ribosomal protein L23 [candidate division KSB1 bacterium]MDZ7306703.1 50S ribosomal protein L23 [candidate division KSB1 bacterium]